MYIYLYITYIYTYLKYVSVSWAAYAEQFIYTVSSSANVLLYGTSNI